MMGVVTAQVVDVHRDSGMIDETLEELADQVHIELSNHCTGKFDAIDQTRTSRKIDHDPRKGLIKRHVGMAVAAQALLVTHCLGQCLPQGNADVLDSVMPVDVQIAPRLDFNVHHAVAGNLIQHVIKKTDTGRQNRLARTIEVQANGNLGFKGIAGNFGLPHGAVEAGSVDGVHDTIRRRLGCAKPRPICLFISHTAMSRYWSETVRRLTPYVPGEQPKLTNLVKLNTNENPYGPSPRVVEAIQAELGDSLRLYPDPGAERLKQAIASHHGISAGQVFVGNGSDEVLAHVFLGLLKHDAPLLFPDVTYSFYPVYCGLYDVPYETIALTSQFEIRVDDYLRPNGGIIFPNPNAPTGRLLPLSEIDRLAGASREAVVVVDEAYVDFGGTSIPSAIPLVARHPNLLVVQTLSKSRSLAGLRVGFAIGHPELIEGLERVKDSFNSYPLDRLAIAGGVAAYEDKKHFEHTRLAVIASRIRLNAALGKLGFDVLPSAANFLFARHPDHDAATLAGLLRERSIIVRHFRQSRIDQYLRITVGTDAQCDTLITALSAILQG